MNASTLNALRHPIMDVAWDLFNPEFELQPEQYPSTFQQLVALDDELANISYQFNCGTENIVVKSKLKAFVRYAEMISDDFTESARDAFEKLKAIAA